MSDFFKKLSLPIVCFRKKCCVIKFTRNNIADILGVWWSHHARRYQFFSFSLWGKRNDSLIWIMPIPLHHSQKPTACFFRAVFMRFPVSIFIKRMTSLFSSWTALNVSSEIISSIKTAISIYSSMGIKMIFYFCFQCWRYPSYTYTKVPLSQRTKKVGEYSVQRNLYSAFLLKNTDIDHKYADRERCSAGFAKFVELQSELISRMKSSGISRKSCFGF